MTDTSPTTIPTHDSTNKLQGKVAIITGGASGIGEATAHLFADRGARAVVVADIQDDKGRRVAEAVGANRCSYVHCDVTDENQVQATVDWTVKTYGQLDIMFSNAGIVSSSDQVILDLDFSQFDRLFLINVRGMAACVKHAARAMVERRVRGSIICTASVVGSKGSKRRTDYTMSKHAVVGLVRAASQQLGEHGIRVNSVSPYAVATPLLQEAHRKEAEEIEKVYEALTPLKGIVLRVNHVADAVLFLASDESAFVSGHDLIVDGGFVR
ncbi:(-)-isopiperitenol/(-)-carveol dehydrogenase, mitochondrial-like [Rhododendron vialii]|uniref:(-)-isopiperitenol/(-)-carveol dehydrogenase, mitochondrial-like n=1 Tax=Rhododendron vialii TaxID=182163 RepID=UPI00265DDC92|nr:(-)-isopiperitenol/(-)-carveol dehydrogenase, mitochondrial-like [Rhododendron vialii]